MPRTNPLRIAMRHFATGDARDKSALHRIEKFGVLLGGAQFV